MARQDDDAIYLRDIASPFGLAAPPRWWTRILADFDPDLRIFPSQKKAVYRVARLARVTGGMNYDRFKHVLNELHPDTKIMFERRCVAVITFGPDVFNRHPMHVINVLRRRDTWALGGGDKATDALERMEAEDEAARVKAWKQESAARRRAMGIAYRYRTGARVSLVNPRRGGSPDPSASTGGQTTTPST